MSGSCGTLRNDAVISTDFSGFSRRKSIASLMTALTFLMTSASSAISSLTIKLDGKAISGKKSSLELSSLSSGTRRSEEHTSELQSLMRISYAVFCLKKQKNKNDYGSARYT